MKKTFKFVSREVVNGRYNQYITKTSIRKYENVTVTTSFVFDECDLNISIRKRDLEECLLEIEYLPGKVKSIYIDVPFKDEFKVDIENDDNNHIGYLYFKGNECWYEGENLIF